MDDSEIKGKVLAEILGMAKKKMVSPKKKAEGAIIMEVEPEDGAEEVSDETSEKTECPACGHCY